jgi:CRP/FNR family cyclic AMP-dependent transcriptional regulator
MTSKVECTPEGSCFMLLFSSASRTDVATALRGVDIFKGLNDRQIAQLAKRATKRDFPAGTHILRRGDTGMALYVIESGRVAVTLESEEGGAERHLAELGPGNAFGEMELIDGEPRGADVTAIEPTRCVLLTRWDFGGEMRRDADIARALLPVMCTRIRELYQRLIRNEPGPTTD